MNLQLNNYIEDMKKMFNVIMAKCIDNAELTTTDKKFLEIYEKTMGTKLC